MVKKSKPRRAKSRRSRSTRGSPSTPEKSEGIDSEGKLEEATLRRFVFQTFGRARRTQDSPVMPDVWLRYIRVAEDIAKARIKSNRRESAPLPSNLVDLLITPWSGVRPGWIAKKLRDRLGSSAPET